MNKNVLAVEANMVGCKGCIVPGDHLSPQIGVLSALVHGRVRLEMFLDKVLILCEHGLNFFIAGVCIEDFVEIASYSVLLIIESIKIDPLDGVDMR